jgi:glutamyl-tRNA reductase
MQLVLVGISHHVAPVELRERVAVGIPEAEELAASLAASGEGEAVCVSTCNRTELYLACADPTSAEELAVEALLRIAELDADELVPSLYRLRDAAAALHLFRVAAGLDSLVPGEGEILGQVRSAFEAGAVGPLLDRLFRQALHVGKKVRAETAIGESPSSVASAGAALAQQVFGELAGRAVLLVGAGDTAELAARNLVSRGATIRAVVNRTLERAEELTRQFGGEAVTLERVEEHLPAADVVVTSTSSPTFVLGRAAVERAVRSRRGRPLLIVDLAVPRDVDPAVRDLADLYLYDVDDLEAVVDQSLAGRRREAVQAEEIVSAEAERFRAWQASLEVVPAITSLRAQAEAIRQRELRKAAGRLDGLSDAERRTVESVTAQILNKLLHLPTVRMKQAAAAADGVVYADAVRHLFGLADEDAR